MVLNSACETFYGRTLVRLREGPADFLAASHPDDRDRVREAMVALSDGEPADLQYRVNEAEDYGRRVWVEAEPIVEDDEVVRVAGIARDVTERRSRER